MLRFTYVVFPIVSTKGFQALAQCDTFHNIDGTNMSLLPSDWHVVCPIGWDLWLLAVLAILLYGAGVPLTYALLLFRCRHEILDGKHGVLSRALTFLHAALHPSSLWWPLIEAARALLLTGFLALFLPGSITQLMFGLITACSFLVLQIWCAPYMETSNNFLAMAACTGLVLAFVTSLGVQVNSKTDVEYVNHTLLLIGLYVAAFAVLAITLLSFLASRSLRIAHARLREVLLDFAGTELRVTDVIKALNEPLLTTGEVETLRSVSLSAAQTAEVATGDRYTAEAEDLVLGEPEAAARGVAAGVAAVSSSGEGSPGRAFAPPSDAGVRRSDRRCPH